MTHKQMFLFTVLAVTSIFSGLAFGLLDVFGFIDGRHTISLTLLLMSAILLYVSLITVFLLNIGHSEKIHSYIIFSAILFGITFFFMNLNPLLTALSLVSYYMLLQYSSRSTTSRFNLFVRFSPREIFFPILRNSFFYILIMLSLLAYGQSRKLLSENSLITPDIVRIVMKPSVSILSQQINSQLQSEVGETLAKLPEAERKQAIQLVLKQTIVNMTNKETGTVYGIPPSEIPINRTSISSTGRIDLSPVFEGMLPIISSTLNSKLGQYALIAPFIIALFTFLIFQPLVIPLQIMESAITLGLFKLLIATRFVKVHTETVEVDRLSL